MCALNEVKGMNLIMINIYNELKKLNKKVDSNDIPVSCIIVKNGKILAKAINNKYKNLNPLGHAEINAIIKASKKLNTTNLNDCELYVTLKPCKMCQEIIQEVRIKKVYYFVENTKNINNTVIYKKIEFDNNFDTEIINFFKNKR